jgi:hypothetical protein
MMKNLFLLFCILIAACRLNAQTLSGSDLNDWENQKVFGINEQYHHVSIDVQLDGMDVASCGAGVLEKVPLLSIESLVYVNIKS